MYGRKLDHKPQAVGGSKIETQGRPFLRDGELVIRGNPEVRTHDVGEMALIVTPSVRGGEDAEREPADAVRPA